ncbi:TPA: hypothetical protein ACTYZB_004815 [Klebsiella variicola]
MNQLLTVNTRFGEATALFNTIDKTLRSLTQGNDDLRKSLCDYEIESLQSDLASGRGFQQKFKSARVSVSSYGTFIFPLHGRDCESRRMEMAFQITMWMIGYHPPVSQIWARSFAQRVVENSERHRDVVYTAGHESWKIKLNGREIGSTRLKSQIIVLEGK